MTDISSDMTVRPSEPTRKDRFDAALKHACLTKRQWCRDFGVSYEHLHFVLKGERPGGPRLNAAIDAMIAEHGVAA